MKYQAPEPCPHFMNDNVEFWELTKRPRPRIPEFRIPSTPSTSGLSSSNATDEQTNAATNRQDVNSPFDRFDLAQEPTAKKRTVFDRSASVFVFSRNRLSTKRCPDSLGMVLATTLHPTSRDPALCD